MTTDDQVDNSTADNASQAMAIQCRDVHVNYRIYSEGPSSFSRRFKRGGVQDAVDVHAVRGVSLDVAMGESLGVVGRNGSGKSSLLGAIAGILNPTSGTVRVRTQPALLGVGAALNWHLSGLRNIMLGGLALGLSQEEIERRQPEIEAFADLGDALNRPLLTYSKGMRARLAFSIATLQDPDILLIDEALAVGDREFRRKSLLRIREIQDRAGAVLLVSHNLREMRRACSRTIWLDEGQIRMDGPTDEVLDTYEELT